MTENKTKIKTVHFGADGYIDYTISPHDKEKRKQYISRHRTNEKLEWSNECGDIIKIYIMGTSIIINRN